MITKGDLQRALVEFHAAYDGPEKWLNHVGMDQEAFMWLIEEFLDSMQKLGDDVNEVTDAEEAMSVHALFLSTIAAAFSFGIEIGKQYPVTPFDE